MHTEYKLNKRELRGLWLKIRTSTSQFKPVVHAETACTMHPHPFAIGHLRVQFLHSDCSEGMNMHLLDTSGVNVC